MKNKISQLLKIKSLGYSQVGENIVDLIDDLYKKPDNDFNFKEYLKNLKDKKFTETDDNTLTYINNQKHEFIFVENKVEKFKAMNYSMYTADEDGMWNKWEQQDSIYMNVPNNLNQAEELLKMFII